MNYEIRIEWDAEADVWYVVDSNVPGLATEAPTIEAMLARLEVMVPELLEESGICTAEEIPFSLLAQRQVVAHRLH